MLDEAALAAAMRERPSQTLTLLAAMSTATDERLRRAVRAVAARLILDRSRVGRPRRTGVGRQRLVSAAAGGDLDVDASTDALVAALAERRTPSLEELHARDWGRTDTAMVVLLDRSGSMTGERLAAAAVTTAACALRVPGELAVFAFARDVETIKGIRDERAPEATVNAVLALRGHGVTDVAGALRAAARELGTARAARRVAVLLSDCRSTDGADPVPMARLLPDLIVLAPQEDCEQAEALCRASGARFGAMRGPDSVPALFDRLLA